MPSIRLMMVAAAMLAAAALAHAQGAPEQKDIHIAVGGKAALYYLPLTIAEQLGYFKAEGLNVKISDFAGGSKALQAVVGGSADVVSGAYEHTINLQSKKQIFQAFVLMGQAPQITIGIASAKAAAYKSPKDLKGMKIGVSAPGSSTNMMVNALLAKDGLKPSDVSIVGVGTGAGAVAAMKSGQIDAISNTDPIMTLLQQEGTVKVIADMRTVKGTESVLGGPMPAACLYAPIGWVEKHPNTAQALANAIVHALKWIENATPQQVLATVPESYLLGNKALYLFSYNAVKGAISTNGMISEAGAKTALRMVGSFSKDVDPKTIDLSKTYTNRFAQNADQKFAQQ